MKKLVLMGDSDREAFYRFCNIVRNTETDKDAFLKAANLQRHESSSSLTSEQRYWLKITQTWAVVIAVIAVGIFACVILK